MEKAYLEVEEDAGMRFYMQFQGKGKIVMLNLLRFRPFADYSYFPELKPDKAVSGEAAYQKYLQSALPELEKAGSRVIFQGKSNEFLIGPESEKWDSVLMIEHESAEKFIEFAENETYLKVLGHRLAGLEDSRLLPILKTT